MSASIQVSGNVEGSIVIGDNNFVVNTNHGTIIYQQAAPPARLREFAPQAPRPPRGFLNRAAELARLEALIRAREPIQLHAADGLGKTSLLKKVANSPAAQALPHGVVWLEPGEANGQPPDPEDLLQRIFDSLFESNPPLKVTAESARAYLSNAQALILLDEIALPPGLQRTLPDILPQSAILASADRPLPGGDYQPLPISPLPRSESIELLAAKSGLEIEPNRGNLDELCALLEDTPLALIITANVLRETQTAPEAALQAIRQISTSERNPTQAALDRAFAYIWQTLSAAEQAVVALAAHTPGLSNAPGWFTYALGEQAEPCLERLQHLGLLYTNSPRLRLPPALRAPAQKPTPPPAGLLAQLSAYLGATLHPEDIASNQQEWGNLQAAFAWAIREKNLPTALSLAHLLDPMLTLRGWWAAWGQILDDLLRLAHASEDRASEAWVLHQIGTRLAGLGETQAATHTLRQALQMRRALKDDIGAAYTQHNLNILLPLPPAPPSSPPRGLPGWLGPLALVAGILLAWLAWPQTPPPAVPTPATAAFTLTPQPTPTLTATPLATPTATPSPTPDQESPTLKPARPDPAESFYGRSVERCQVPGQVNLQVYAFDPGGLANVEVIYWYGFSQGDDNDDTQRFNAPMQPGQGDFYTLTIDHNLESRAQTALNGQDGFLFWQVSARDSAGNISTLGTQPHPVRVAYCDTSSPVILQAYTSPGAGTFGNFRHCTAGVYSSFQQLHVILQDESALKNVSATYYYALGSKTGTPIHQALVPYRGNRWHHYAVIEHNPRAAQTLGERNGQMIWQITASDEHGNITQSPAYPVEMNYRFCPPPG